MASSWCSSHVGSITTVNHRRRPPLVAVRCGKSDSIIVNNLCSNGDDEHYYSKRSIKYWDKFYKLHQNKFFKDRHYLAKDWEGHFSSEKDNDHNNTSLTPSNRKVVLEVGCGAGNTMYPLLAAYPNLHVHACDFSPQAVSLVKNLNRVLKPNGFILFRDYAIGDSAQVKLQKRNQIISENYCFRGDGTCSFYFSEDFLTTMFVRAGFKVVDVNTYCRQTENRLKNITMQRRWIRATFGQL